MTTPAAQVLASPRSTAVLSASDVEAVLEPLALIDAVEDAFRSQGSGQHPPSGVLAVEAAEGTFHIKVAALAAGEGVLAAKLNANYPQNPTLRGLPTIQGLVIVSDVTDGSPLAVMESGAVTRLRTAAATAVAFRHLAPAAADSLTIIGCGAQAFDQVRFTAKVRPLRRLTLFDHDPAAAARLAARLNALGPIQLHVASTLEEAAAASAMIITSTTSRTPFLEDRHIGAGVTVAAVGADNPHKSELAPALMASAKVVTDSTPQCAAIGDLHHAIAAGTMRADEVHAEIGEVIAGRCTGRTSPRERIIFDSTGTPIQDAAAATLVVSLARARGIGTAFRFRD